MNVGQIVAGRRAAWVELEKLCDLVDRRSFRDQPEQVARFAGLYREACADLSLAEAWQLPPSTVDYLQSLVARAHHRLYRSREFGLAGWLERAFLDTPRRIFAEPAIHIATLVFWGLSLMSGYLACNDQLWPDFAEQVAGTDALEQMEEMYADFDQASTSGGGQGGGRSLGQNFSMAGFYIRNNAGIGLECFASMILILPGFVTLAYNAVFLGAIDGYMLRPEMGSAGINFRNFTTAHGPLELTAIVLSAGAGLKIGMGWFRTGGLRRLDSLVVAGRESLPIALCAVVLFAMAAAIEGFVSPLPDHILPWWFKGLVALVTSTLLMFYFVVLGFPWRQR